MQLDLRKASKLLRKHIAERVRDYPLYINEGPGEDEAPIKQITVGYQFDQAGWVALVFDTRPRPKADGQWNSFIEPNAIAFPEWHKAFHTWADKGAAIKVTLPDGTKTTFGKGATIEEIAECLGATIRDVLVSARDDGEFARLPIAAECMYVVEEHDGYYGWSAQGQDARKSRQGYLAHLEGDVTSKPVDGRIAHWVNVLDRVASGKEADSEWSFLASDHAIERLKELGDPAVVPVLKFVRKWANKPEFDGDRPTRKINELPMQTPTTDALMMVCDSAHATSEVESLLCEILRRSIAVNTGRRLWGIIPVWAARCLSLFDKYPEPIQHESTNELLNRDEYRDKRRTRRRT